MASFNLVSPKDFIPRFFEVFKKDGGYNGASFAKDCLAGVTVGVVALPLAMAFSIAAGGTPAQGLYTAVTAGFLISFLGGSRCQIGGPTGAFVVIIFDIVARNGMAGLTIATIMAGLILIIMGLSGLGRLIRFIPYPVTTGFTTGIALLIFSQQVKDFFGLSPSNSSPEFIHMWKGYFGAIRTVQPVTLVIGLGTLAVIILIRKFAPKIPAAVVGVAAATLVSYLLKLDTQTIGTRFGGIPQSLPVPALPPINGALIRELLPDSFAIALLAAIESLLSAVVADGMTGDRHNANMELVAQGAGNIASALFGGIPATGAIARTATNIKSGALSPVAGIIHAVTLLFFILFLAPLASAVPLVSLSAVLMVVSWDMSSLPIFSRILIKAPKSDAFVLLTTFVLTVLVDLTFAVEVGVVLAVFLFFRRMVEITGIKPGGASVISEIMYGNSASGRADEGAAENAVIPEHPKNVEVYEITGPFFFGIADMLQRILWKPRKETNIFILRMRDVPAVDSTGIAALESFLSECRHAKIRLVLCELREHPRSALKKAGFIKEIGEENILPTLEDALGSCA